MQNRSVPANILLPHIVYTNVPRSIAWLQDVFGFRERYRHGDPKGIMGAQLHLGDAFVMLSSVREGRGSPASLGAWTQSLTMFVDEVEAHYGRTKARGAKIVEELHETPYGELQYGVEDLEGHLWLFSRHVRDVAPEAWGASLAGDPI